MATQAEKGQAFRALHERDGAFILPNPWDAGTARLLAHLGFAALATTSMGYAFSAGQKDNTIERHQMMLHLSAITAATGLPVSADLENGFGDAPDVVAETIRLAALAGVVGGSIEDATGRPDQREPARDQRHLRGMTSAVDPSSERAAVPEIRGEGGPARERTGGCD